MKIEVVDDLRASSWCRRLGSTDDGEAGSDSRCSTALEDGSRR